MSEIGKEIRRMREGKGWSQAELAVYSGSSQPTVNQIESGKRNPSTATLVKLAKALEVEVADLFPKAQSSLFTQPPREAAEEESILQQLEEALSSVGAPTRRLSLPREKFEALYENLTRAEVIELNKSLSRERELLKPLLWQWRTMPPSEERDRLIALWRESFARALSGTAAAARAGDMDATQELAGDMEAAQELSSVA
jgi:transcriptional regulator with XRE-family HTH domain